jgi:hypothetical protein
VSSLPQRWTLTITLDACPGGSFCLTQGYCCPNELDPSTCALNNGVSLSAGFNTEAVPPTPAASASSSATYSGAEPSPTTDAPSVYSNPPYISSTDYSINTALATSSHTVTPFLGSSGKVDGAVGFVIGAVAGVLGLVI